jgi:uncharacterized membrane protein YeiH
MTAVDLILYTGIFVFALTGALKARTFRMDIFGAAVLAFVTAYGGGTIRDLLLGIRVGWLNDNIPLILVAAAVILVFLLKQNLLGFEKTLFITDAIGLAMFTAGGIERSLVHGISEPYAIVWVFSPRPSEACLPIVFRPRTALLQKGELYATASAIGGIAYIGLKHTNLSQNLSLLTCVTIVVIVRVISKKRNLQLHRDLKIPLPGEERLQ